MMASSLLLACLNPFVSVCVCLFGCACSISLGVNRLEFMAVMEAHEGSGTRVRTMDRDLKEWIEKLTSHYPDTAFFILGDHDMFLHVFGAASSPALSFHLFLLASVLPSLFFPLFLFLSSDSLPDRVISP